MIFFSNIRTPLPDGLDLEEASECSLDYWRYHKLFVGEIRRKLGDIGFEELNKKVRVSETALKKLGVAINAEYLALVRKKFHEDNYNRKYRLIGVLFFFLILGLNYWFALLPDEPLILMACVAAADYGYFRHNAGINLLAAKNKLEGRKHERQLSELDFLGTFASDVWSGFELEKLATIKLYLDDPYGEWVSPGQIDHRRRPENLRPVAPVTAKDILDNYGANFENLDDPRIPAPSDGVVSTKILIALLPDSVRYEINTSLSEKYSYYPTHFWDYFEFQCEWKSGEIKRIPN